jgi:hypothetical protein
MNKQQILVTGASGTIGSDLVKLLAQAGQSVRAGFHSRQPNISGVQPVQLDPIRGHTGRRIQENRCSAQVRPSSTCTGLYPFANTSARGNSRSTARPLKTLPAATQFGLINLPAITRIHGGNNK